MEQSIVLMGDLSERYGKIHSYKNLKTPSDALRLLCINRPGLADELFVAHQNGIGYTLTQGSYGLDYGDLQLPIGQKPLILTPVISGSGGEQMTPILIGAGLIAASFLFPGAGFFGTVGLFGAGQAAVGVSSLAVLNAAAVGTALSAVGASLIITGIANIISPMPTLSMAKGEGDNVRASGPQGVSRATDGVQNYSYSGAVNTAGANGAAVPIVYGKCLIGSHLISVEFESDAREDKAHPAGAYIRAQGPQTITVNSEALTADVVSAGGVRSKRIEDPSGEISRYSPAVDILQSDGEPLSLIETISIAASTDNVGVKENMRDNEAYLRKNNKSKNFQVILQLNNGLFDFAGGIGSTKVDAFFTYQIDVIHEVSPGEDPVVASISGSVSGLLDPGEQYTWIHWIEYSEPANPQDRIKPNIKILDFRAQPGCTLQVVRQGYKVLRSGNTTHRQFED
jgi:predicted phage tail protein